MQGQDQKTAAAVGCNLVDYSKKMMEVEDCLHGLKLAGFLSIEEVCRAIIGVEFSDIMESSAWNTCNLTGEVCAESIHFSYKGVFYNVHSRFRYFVNCLWLCMNVQRLQEQCHAEHAGAGATNGDESSHKNSQDRIAKSFAVAHAYVYKTLLGSM